MRLCVSVTVFEASEFNVTFLELGIIIDNVMYNVVQRVMVKVSSSG